MGEAGKGGDGCRPGCGQSGRHRPRRMGLFCTGNRPYQLFLNLPGGDRRLCHSDDHAVDGAPAQERQDDNGNGMGQHAPSRRICAGAQCRYGDFIDDVDGLCTVFFPGSLACVWSHA